MSFEVNLTALIVALVAEAALGYPPVLYRAIAHPVVWIGTLIAWLDARLNRPTMPEPGRRINGLLAALAVVAVAAGPALALQIALIRWLPWAAAGVLLALPAAALIAQRSLAEHVAAVADALDRGGLEAGRTAVAKIVGRDPDRLDEQGVARAAIESLAENFSDGVVAPALWCGVFGLPGVAGYKAINTADSMVGHRTDRHRAFGWAAARLDDLVNLPASRLAALWLLLAALVTPGVRPVAGLRAALRDATRHRSPNAGWPEAAMAGALGLRLGGPRTYGATVIDDHWMGDGRAEATAADIRRALRLYRVACAIQMAAVLALAALIAPWR